MKKPLMVQWFVAFMAIGLFSGCGDHQGSTPPILAQIAKSFTASSVDENNVTVFSTGGSNVAAIGIRPGYSKFLLDLSTPPGATLRDFDGNTFVAGKWILLNNNRLILQNLTPQPTGTGGTIEFDVNSISDTQLVLTRTSASAKTGGLIVKYTLVTK